MEFEAGIRLVETEAPAKALMALKKLTGLSLAELKSKISAGDYVFTCDAVDDEELALFNKIRREMKKMGVETRVFENGEEENPVLFDNMAQRHRETAKMTAEPLDTCWTVPEGMKRIAYVNMHSALDAYFEGDEDPSLRSFLSEANPFLFSDQASADPAVWAGYSESYDSRFQGNEPTPEESRAFVMGYLDSVNDEYRKAFGGSVVFSEAFAQIATPESWQRAIEEYGEFGDEPEEYDQVRTLVDKEGFPAGTTGVVLSVYTSGPACEVEPWDEKEHPIDVVTYQFDEVEVID